jgi:hypothetical protein
MAAVLTREVRRSLSGETVSTSKFNRPIEYKPSGIV